MIDIAVRNFQSIEKLSMQIEGFTALVGRSNIGKSALVRALKAALTNELGTGFVRHELDCARLRRGLKTCKCQTTVHLTMDGFDLLWEKGDAVNRYTFNGQVFDSPGQGIPEFLTENGFAPVKVGDKFGMIQVADQFFPIFLLNQSGPAVADAISDVARLDRINKAMRRVDRDKRENVATRKVREKDVTTLKEKLTSFNGLDASISKVEAAAACLDEMSEAHETVTLLGAFLDRSQIIVARIREVLAAGKVTIPEKEPLLEKWEEADGLASFHTRIVRSHTEYKTLVWVVKFVVPDVDPATKVLKSLLQLEGWSSRHDLNRERLEKIETARKAEAPALENLVEVHAKAKNLANYSAKLLKLAKSVKSLEDQHKVASVEEAAVLAGFQALGVCPTCTQAIEGRHPHE